MRSASWVDFAARTALVATAFFLTGRIGLLMPYIENQITLLWPPSGIALAALVLGGPRHALGVYLGALLIQVSLGAAPIWWFIGPLANTLSALAGAYALTRVFRFR